MVVRRMFSFPCKWYTKFTPWEGYLAGLRDMCPLYKHALVIVFSECYSSSVIEWIWHSFEWISVRPLLYNDLNKTSKQWVDSWLSLQLIISVVWYWKQQVQILVIHIQYTRIKRDLCNVKATCIAPRILGSVWCTCCVISFNEYSTSSLWTCLEYTWKISSGMK